MFVYSENSIEKIELFLDTSSQNLRIKRSRPVNLFEPICLLKFNYFENNLFCLSESRNLINVVEGGEMATSVHFGIQGIVQFKLYKQAVLAINDSSEVEIRSLTKSIYRKSLQESLDVEFLPDLGVLVSINFHLQLELYLTKNDVLLDIISPENYDQNLNNCFNFIFKPGLREFILIESNNILRGFETPAREFYEGYFLSSRSQSKGRIASKSGGVDKVVSSERKMIQIDEYFKCVNTVNIDQNKLEMLEKECLKLKKLVGDLGRSQT